MLRVGFAKTGLTNTGVTIASSDETSVITLSLKDANSLRRWLNDQSRKLRPEKDWLNCSYEHHHDTCDCQGVGGDR